MVLVRVSRLVQTVFAEVSRCHGLTTQQTQLLCVLSRGPVGMTELSRSLHLEKSSLTGLVDRVERRGLVERVPDARDRRACHVTLTAEGTHCATEVHQAVTERLDALGAELPAAEREAVAAALARVLSRDDTPRPFPAAS